MRFIIVHGTTSRPERSWFPWITWQLGRDGHDVYVPRLPTPEGQSYQTWVESLQASIPGDSSPAVFIGHSTGSAFLLRYLSEDVDPVTAAGLFLVSSFCQPLSLPDYPSLEKIVNEFVLTHYNWRRLIEHIPVRRCFHGEGDQLVPLSHGEYVARHLEAELRVIPDGRHLNTEAGFTEFPDLLQSIRSVTSPR